MNITLRKANALQTSINDAIKSIDFETTVKINEFQDPETVIAEAEKVFATNMVKRDGLYHTLYEIRKAVSKANDTAGISQRLADVAHLDKQIVFFGSLATKPVREEAKIIAGKLDKIRNRKEESRASIYGYGDDVSTSILDKEEVEGFKKLTAVSKKNKQKIQDEILELNVKTEITISDKSVAVLQAEGLI
jgi:hypothetical protein